jgi:hypothetical protein
VSNFFIFGLVRPSQQHLAIAYEPRRPAHQTLDTSYRLQTLLQQDIADAAHLDAIVLSSCLWDLSYPVTNTSTVTDAFLLEYHAAIARHTRALRRLYPSAMLFWKTCFPTKGGLDRPDERPAGNTPGEVHPLVTRTRKSQGLLNNALEAAVRELQASGEPDVQLIDAWKMMHGFSYLATDGRHYPRGPSLAVLNLVLNAVKESLHRGRAHVIDATM